MKDSLEIEPYFTFRLFLDDYLPTSRNGEELYFKNNMTVDAFSYEKVKLDGSTKILDDEESDNLTNSENEKLTSISSANEKRGSFCISNFVPKRENSFLNEMSNLMTFHLNSVSLTFEDIDSELKNSHAELLKKKLIGLLEIQ